MDRIDIFVEVDEILSYGLKQTKTGGSSSNIAKKVEAARHLQQEKYKAYDIRTNSQLNGKLLQKFVSPEQTGKDLLKKFALKNRISLRSYNRILRVARTIADLDQKETIKIHHIAEALNYRAYYST